MNATASHLRSTNRPVSLERVLCALAGTVTLTSVALSAFVSPLFLLGAMVTGVSQWAYVLVGACPASLLLRRFTSLQGCRQ
jgi:hypothetical protein